MKLLFLGAFCSETEEKILLSKSKYGIQNSIMIFQRNLFNGIEHNLKIKADRINFLPTGTFPNYQDIIIQNKRYTNNGIDIIELGTINVPILKQLILNYKAKRQITHWIKKSGNEKKYIVMYDLLYPYLRALHKINGKFDNLITCTVIADLPNQFGYAKNEKWFKRTIKTRMGQNQLRYIRNINYFGLLTEQMRNVLDIKEQNSVVIEGFSSPTRFYKELHEEESKIILYSGALFKIYNLDILIEAFKIINASTYELWICGSGDYAKNIISETHTDNRIKYFGYLEQEEVAKLQSKATVLINPRQNIGEYIKYSFPSKIIEYLSTGRPVISYKLDGIPNEYYDHLISPPDNSILGLSDTIVKVCKMTFNERRDIGNRGRNFVIKNKNPKTQCKKLINLFTNHCDRP